MNEAGLPDYAGELICFHSESYKLKTPRLIVGGGLS